MLAFHVATGNYTTFVISEDGDVYSFGCGESFSLGHATAIDGQVCTAIPVFVVCLDLIQAISMPFLDKFNKFLMPSRQR